FPCPPWAVGRPQGCAYAMIASNQGSGPVTLQRGAPSQPWLTVEQEIAERLSRIDAQSFRNLVQAFENRDRRWFFSGQGRSGLVAQMAAMRLMHVGYETHFVGEATAPSVRKGDGLLLVCGSGQTPISLQFA